MRRPICLHFHSHFHIFFLSFLFPLSKTNPLPPQPNLQGNLALEGTGELLHDDAADDAVRDTAAGADLHVHPHRDSGLGQAAPRRGGKLPGPADGQVETKGRCLLILANLNFVRL